MIQTLTGFRVVDLTRKKQAGAAYSKLLAEYGAEVILVETPDTDASRLSHANDFYHGGKKSIALDLHKEEGRQILLALLKSADVFMTDYVTAELQSLGADYPSVRAVNPAIIYAHGSIYGEQGPLKDTAADAAAVWWASSGAAWCSMELGDLAPVLNPGLAEVNPAKTLCLGVCAALYHRWKTGEGMYVSTSVLADAIYSNADSPLEMQYGAEYPKTRKRPRRATLNTYRCRDGWIMFITLSFDKDWNNLLTALNLTELIGDPRWTCLDDSMYENSPPITAIFDEAFAKFTCDEIVSRIKAYDMACMKIKTTADVLQDPQILANRYLITVEASDGKQVTIPTGPVRFGDNEPAPFRPAPAKGENTEQILHTIGFDDAAIGTLAAQGVIFPA